MTVEMTNAEIWKHITNLKQQIDALSEKTRLLWNQVQKLADEKALSTSNSQRSEHPIWDVLRDSGFPKEWLPEEESPVRCHWCGGTNTKDVQDSYWCDDCDKPFMNPKEEASSSQRKPFVCWKCDRRFDDETQLEFHYSSYNECNPQNPSNWDTPLSEGFKKWACKRGEKEEK